MRYFKIDPQAYEQSRLYLDSLFEHPNGRADTCIPPEPIIHEGKAMLACPDEFADWAEVAPLIAELLSSGEAEEITQEEYEASISESTHI